MKTIKEAAKGIPENKGFIMSSSVQAIEVAFKSGVEFAQRWIPVEEELPGIYYISVIVKDSGGNWDKAVLTGLGWQFINDKTEVGKVTHWRPIELK